MSFIASAQNFLESLGISALSENALQSYFCDADTYDEVAAGSTMSQGSVISICFNVVEGEEFEVDDILDLIVEDLAESQQSQNIVVAGDLGASGYAEKHCEQSTNTTMTCVVSFLLKASFYDYDSSELTGQGAAIVELGGLEGRKRRRHLIKFQTGPRRLTDGQAVTTCQIKPKQFKVKRLEPLNDKTKVASSASESIGRMTFLGVSAVVVVCSLLL